MITLNDETRRALVDERQARLRADWTIARPGRAAERPGRAGAPARRWGWLRPRGWKAAHAVCS